MAWPQGSGAVRPCPGHLEVRTHAACGTALCGGRRGNEGPGVRHRRRYGELVFASVHSAHAETSVHCAYCPDESVVVSPYFGVKPGRSEVCSQPRSC
jgi:hypothetical protein